MGRHRRKRGRRPVRTGLLGASAAMAVGAVAVTSGLLPGGDTFTFGGDSSTKVRTEGSAKLDAQGGASASPTDTPAASPSLNTGPDADATPSKSPASPSKSASPTPAKPSATPSQKTKAPAPAPKPEKTKAETATTAPPRTQPPSASRSAERTTPTAEAGSKAAAEAAAVLSIVNAERAKAGCSAVRADGALANLAEGHSQDMKDRGFFDHTNPDGESPWDRAAEAGVSNLGGENIARGQADAEAVMNAWMNSDGHRANILNCEYKTLGIGVVLGTGGPWWTQNFGF
ncbi:CAP domain-containing protein [Streptomyces sp. HNM0663]|uniref:CAP domain-containing protein n=1 Tax=Streptomyces chengmaiensis TaxID=3040919 RepID=A0ABT6HRP1_9ACTN|nr:CAP domain-containing protein [Streptomyces chengmaiensis]MDH2391380.1 CAP domain-containing protein [Streptomyces chengmaiensis]